MCWRCGKKKSGKNMKSLGESLEGPVFPQSSKNEGKNVVFFEHTNFAFIIVFRGFDYHISRKRANMSY